MSKIDISSWGEFFIFEVFETSKKGKSLQVPTGANVQKKDLEEGSIPRITVTGINNGIYDYYADIPNDNNYRVYENFISVSFLGTVFYQKGKASLDMKVHCLKPIKHTLNEYTGEFLITAILASLKESSYSNQISSTVLPLLTIKLPIDSKGNPDWQYMEDYMRNIEVRVGDSLSKLESAKAVENNKIDISSWGEFRIGDYFKVEYGKFRPKELLGNGEFNYVTTSGFNNGITDKIDEVDNVGNCITVASDGAMGSAFYQDKPFSTSNIVSTLTPFETTPLNKYNALFLCTLIFSKRGEFGWLGYKFSVDRVRNLKLKLPIDSKGNPDWLYMENYMKALEINVKDFLDKTA